VVTVRCLHAVEARSICSSAAFADDSRLTPMHRWFFITSFLD
jgi:hypothetical protein